MKGVVSPLMPLPRSTPRRSSPACRPEGKLKRRFDVLTLEWPSTSKRSSPRPRGSSPTGRNSTTRALVTSSERKARPLTLSSAPSSRERSAWSGVSTTVTASTGRLSSLLKLIVLLRDPGRMASSASSCSKKVSVAVSARASLKGNAPGLTPSPRRGNTTTLQLSPLCHWGD